MPIFRRDPDLESADAESSSTPYRSRPMVNERPSNSTRVAAGTEIEGKISGGTDVVIDGRFLGTIDVGSSVVIGKSGRVDGGVLGRVVRVAGAVKGDIHGGERVEIMTTGRVEGDVVAPRVIIAEGAFLKGKVEMRERKAAQATGEEKEKAPAASEGKGLEEKK